MLLGVNIIEGAYFHDLLSQPEALRNALAGLKVCTGLDTISRNLVDGHYRRILLTGMGSSFHALYPTHLALTADGFFSLMVETSELLHYMPQLLEAGTLLIAVSQSGKSAEVVRLMERVPRDASVIGVTNDDTSSLAMRADAVLRLGAGTESTVSCKTYVTSLLVLEWLSAYLRGRHIGLVEELSEAAEAARQYLENWRAHVDALAEKLDRVAQVFVTGRGTSLAAVGTGGLILKESARFPSEGMSSAAFRHGPFEMLSPSVFVLVFAGDSSSTPLNSRLVEDITAVGGRAALAGWESVEEVYRLPRVPSCVRPIVEILPVQMMSLALAALKGIEAGRFQLASKITKVE